MPRAGQVKAPAGERLADRIAIGLLTATFPPELVDRVIRETGRGQQRSRLLPARVVVYYVLAMCLFFGQGYEEVARLLTGGLEQARQWRGSWQVPTTGAIARARARLGPEPLEALFGQACRPLAAEGAPGSFYRGWRLVAIDGTTLDVPDTEANSAHFGRPGSSRGTGGGAFPQARMAALGECGTHAVFGAAIGPLSVHETELARRLFPRLEPGMLMAADRGFLGFDLWREAAATGADLLWRVKNSAVLPSDEELPDGSYLSRIYAARDKNRHADPEVVRVVEYTLDDPGTVYRLMTTILEPERAPAADLAALYSQRWEIELVFDELKTHQGAPRMVLRSQAPPGVEQEAWGFLLVHYAIRALMARAAAGAGLDPDRLSFTRTLRIARRQVTAQAAFSPLPPGQGTDHGTG